MWYCEWDKLLLDEVLSSIAELMEELIKKKTTTNYQIILFCNSYRAAEEDVEAQRQELMSGFDDAQRKREHEFRKKADDLSNSLLTHELKVCIKSDQE